jgi:hypothetical protein
LVKSSVVGIVGRWAGCHDPQVKRSLLVAAALVLTSLVLMAHPPATAAPGGDATVVVKGFSIPAPDIQATTTVMCPAGTRATGGGAAPSPPASLTTDLYRVFYSAPVDENGTASTTDAGDVPRGWQVSVGNYGPQPQAFKAFVICSANSDAVLAASQPSSTGTLDVAVSCPPGSRAIGGGVGKINDDVIPGGTVPNPLYETGPVDTTLTFAGTQDGDVAAGWRTVVESTSYGDRFFAVCSAQSDAVVRSASYTLPQVDNAAGGAAVACPTGMRALSGGQGNDGTNDAMDRVALMGPFTTTAGLESMVSGQVPRGWSAYGQSTTSEARTNRVFAVCATDTVVPVTAPPDTKVTTVKIRRAKHKATFAFSGVGRTSGFQCKLKRPNRAASYRSCSSPKVYKRLARGKYTFFVRAFGPGGTDSTPARYRFRI